MRIHDIHSIHAAFKFYWKSHSNLTIGQSLQKIIGDDHMMNDVRVNQILNDLILYSDDVDLNRISPFTYTDFFDTFIEIWIEEFKLSFVEILKKFGDLADLYHYKDEDFFKLAKELKQKMEKYYE